MTNRLELRRRNSSQQGHEGHKADIFKQEAAEETENARTDALQATVDVLPLLSPFPPVQNVCFVAFVALL